jgi:hypothetical protein
MRRLKPFTALLAAGLLAGCAAATETGPDTDALELGAPGDTPGTLVADPFASGERVAATGKRLVHAGHADGAAYFYTPDFRLARVATGPDVVWGKLGYERPDWEVECAPGPPARCTVRIAGKERRAGSVAPAVEVTEDGATRVLCVGPDDARDAAVRAAPLDPWDDADPGGCFSPGASRDLLDRMKIQERFSYRYESGSGGRIDGWRPAFGMDAALRLAEWMRQRVAP